MHYRHAESWKLVNQITGRKAAKKGIIKGGSKEERLKNWYTHFSELLGKEPIVSDEFEEIQRVLPDLDIDDSPFTMEEYQAVKKNLNLIKPLDQTEFHRKFSSIVISIRSYSILLTMY